MSILVVEVLLVLPPSSPFIFDKVTPSFFISLLLMRRYLIYLHERGMHVCMQGKSFFDRAVLSAQRSKKRHQEVLHAAKVQLNVQFVFSN